MRRSRPSMCCTSGQAAHTSWGPSEVGRPRSRAHGQDVSAKRERGGRSRNAASARLAPPPEKPWGRGPRGTAPGSTSMTEDRRCRGDTGGSAETSTSSRFLVASATFFLLPLLSSSSVFRSTSPLLLPSLSSSRSAEGCRAPTPLGRRSFTMPRGRALCASDARSLLQSGVFQLQSSLRKPGRSGPRTGRGRAVSGSLKGARETGVWGP